MSVLDLWRVEEIHPILSVMLRAGSFLLVVWLAAGPGWSQETEKHSRQATLDISVGWGGPATITLDLNFSPPNSDSLEQAVAGIFNSSSVPEAFASEDFWMCSQFVGDAFQVSGMVTAGKLRLHDLKEALDEAGVEEAIVTVEHGNADFVEMQPEIEAPHESADFVIHRLTGPPDSLTDEIKLAFGFRSQDLQRVVMLYSVGVFGPPLFVLLFGIAALAGWNVVERRRFSDLGSGIVFLSLAHVLWNIVIPQGSLDHFASYLLSRAGYDGTTYALLWRLSLFGPPIVGGWLSALVVHPFRLRFGGSPWTVGQTFGQAFWGQWRYFWPLMSILTAFSAAVYVGWASTAAWLVAAFIGWKLCSVYSEAAKGLDMQALDSGDLYERISGLAEKAGVALQGVWILRTADSRPPNAFACSGQQVVLSDSLVSNLTKGEVDAVAAHELRHLERRHPWALWIIWILVLTVFYFVGLFGLALLMPGVLPEGVFDIAFLLFSVLSLGFISRRFERTADDGAVEISEDPKSFITGQAKLAALHETPERQSAFEELWSTHPSFRKRIERAADKANITYAQLEEWLQTPPDGGEHYELPGHPATDTRVFSAQTRFRTLSRVVWTWNFIRTIAVVVAVPFIHSLAESGEGFLALLGVFACLLFGFRLLVTTVEPFSGMRRLQQKLFRKLRADGLDPGEVGVLHVGVAPVPGQADYAGFKHADEGLLYLGFDALVFVGETLRFSISRQDIESLSIERLDVWNGDKYVVLRRKQSLEGEAPAVRLFEVHTGFQILFSRFRLSTQLNDWLRGNGPFASLPATGALPAPPADSPVPTAAVSGPATPGVIANELLTTGLLTFGVVGVFGFPLELTLTESGLGWHMVAAVLASEAIFWSRHLELRPQKTSGDAAGLAS